MIPAMKRLKYVIYVAIVGIMFGCASGRRGELPDASGAEGAAEIIVTRGFNPVSGWYGAYVYFDGKEIFALDKGEYTKFYAPTGAHKLSVKMSGAFSGTLDVSLIANTAHYYAIRPNAFGFSLVEVPESQAKPFLDSVKFIKIDDKAK